MICPVCGIEFEPHRARQAYCGPHCKKLAANRRQNAAHSAARAAARGTRTCPVCGTVFTPKSSLAVYCSRKCRNAKFRSAKPSRPPPPKPPPPAEDARLEKVRAYLALPPGERWMRRGELTADELRMAQKIWDADHGSRCVAVNHLV